ncbi:MAG TPA: dihydroneopterin aldolase [bacterium]
MGTDRLELHDVEVDCRIGVFEWERERPQRIRIDVSLTVDAEAASRVDDMSAAVDYGRLVTRIRQFAGQGTFGLMETLAHRLAGLLAQETPSAWVRVRVKKSALPGIGFAAVEVERGPRAAGASPRPRGGLNRGGTRRRSARSPRRGPR